MNYHRLGGSNNKHLFPIDLESGKSKISAPADSASGSEMAFSLCLHLVEGTTELSGVIFRRAINSFIGIYSHELITSPNALSISTIILRFRTSVYEFIGGTHSVWDSPGGAVVKNPPANAGNDSGEENDNSLQCSSLRNPMDREA